MPKVNKVVYAKYRKHDRHHCAYILLNINCNMELLIVWFEHPTWGEQVIPHHWIQGNGLVIHQGE
eukprot:12931312-Ditylum_brightwellii.AAC.1